MVQPAKLPASFASSGGFGSLWELPRRAAGRGSEVGVRGEEVGAPLKGPR